MLNDLLRNAIYYAEAFAKRPLLALVPGVTVLVVALAAILQLPRTYQSEALLMVEPTPASSMLLPETVMSEQLQFIEQRVLAREKLLALANEFDLFPGARAEMSTTMLADLVRQHININTVAAEPSARHAATSAMRVAFRSDSAERTAAVTSRLVDMIIEENRRLRIQRATEATRFLELEAKTLAERIAQREAEWRDFVAANADAMPARVTGLESELHEREREASTQAATLAALTQEIQLSEVELRTAMQSSEPVAQARHQLTQLEAEHNSKSVIYSAEHPEMRSLNQRIESLRQRIALGIATPAQRPDLPPELTMITERIAIGKRRQETLQTEHAETISRITELRDILTRAPAVQAQVDAFERDRAGIWRASDDTNGKLAAARSSERLEIADSNSQVQIIEQPEIPLYPASPNRKRLFLLALAAAFGAGIGGVYLGDSLQRTIRGSFDLRNALAGSTLVMIPDWQPQNERRKLVDVALDWLAGVRHPKTQANA